MIATLVRYRRYCRARRVAGRLPQTFLSWRYQTRYGLVECSDRVFDGQVAS